MLCEARGLQSGPFCLRLCGRRGRVHVLGNARLVARVVTVLGVGGGTRLAVGQVSAAFVAACKDAPAT